MIKKVLVAGASAALVLGTVAIAQTSATGSANNAAGANAPANSSTSSATNPSASTANPSGANANTSGANAPSGATSDNTTVSGAAASGERG